MIRRDIMLYVMNVWSTVHQPEQIETIKNMVKQTGTLRIQKPVYLNRQGLRNYMIQIYGQERWAGSPYNHFRGIWRKVDQCYVEKKPLHVLAFECDKLIEVVKLKERIRAYCKIGKSSVHTSDTKEQADRTLRLLLHKNTVDFMNTVWPDKYPYLVSRLRKFAKKREQYKIPLEDLVLISESVFTLYGKKRKRKISWITRNGYHTTNIEKYNKKEFEAKITDVLKETAFLEENVIYFWNLKFVTLKYLLEIV